MRGWLASLLLGCAPAVAAEAAIEAPGPAGALQGTLLAPGSRGGPVVLIIPGSGPTDRDGNNPLGVKAATYRLLAEGLAARGVTSVRIDKRGMFGSAAAVPDANAVTVADYVADTRSWVGAIRQRTGAPCVWLLGHSEGGLVALAARGLPDVCGLVLVATAGRPMGQVLREQLRANPANAPLLPQADDAIRSLESGRRVEAAPLHPALQGLFAPPVQGFLISLFAQDPARLLAGFERPVLILQGQRDLQVGEADAKLLKRAAPRARLVLLPDTNHVLKQVRSADPGANLATYADAQLPLARGVLEAVGAFLARPAP